MFLKDAIFKLISQFKAASSPITHKCIDSSTPVSSMRFDSHQSLTPARMQGKRKSRIKRAKEDVELQDEFQQNLAREYHCHKAAEAAMRDLDLIKAQGLAFNARSSFIR